MKLLCSQRKLRDLARAYPPRYPQAYIVITVLDDHFYRSRSGITRDVFPELSQVNTSWLENVAWVQITHSGLSEPSVP